MLKQTFPNPAIVMDVELAQWQVKRWEWLEEPSSSAKARKEGLCFICGANSHQARDCPQRGKVKQIDGDESSADEPESEKIVMTLTSHLTGVESSRSISSSPSTESLGIHESVLSSKDNSSHGSKDMRSQWLVDSGATSHIVAKKYLGLY